MGGFMSNIILSGDTSGAITIAAPAVAGTNTLTLPASTGTVALTSQLPVAGPAFSAYLSSTQSISASTATKVTLDTEEFDTNNCFASSRFTPTTEGYYFFSGTVGCGGSGMTALVAMIYKNGSAIKTTDMITSYSQQSMMVVSDLVYCNGTTDYIEFWGQINASSGTIFISTTTRFSGFLARSA